MVWYIIYCHYIKCCKCPFLVLMLIWMKLCFTTSSSTVLIVPKHPNEHGRPILCCHVHKSDLSSLSQKNMSISGCVYAILNQKLSQQVDIVFQQSCWYWVIKQQVVTLLTVQWTPISSQLGGLALMPVLHQMSCAKMWIGCRLMAQSVSTDSHRWLWPNNLSPEFYWNQSMFAISIANTLMATYSHHIVKQDGGNMSHQSKFVQH